MARTWKRARLAAWAVVATGASLGTAWGGGTEAIRPSEAEIAAYRADVDFLANPLMEGRGPGLAGNRTAAEFLEQRFKALGLAPAFAKGVRPDGTEESPSYFHQFTAGREVKVQASTFTFTPVGEGLDARVERQTLVMGDDFVVLGNSGAGTVEAPVAFVGYSLAAGDGRGGVSEEDASYIESDDLSGRIALMFRFEPLNERGKSRLTSDGAWSAASAISQKIMAAVDRNAAGIILVSPPNVDDPRAMRLETPEASAAWTRSLKIPVVMLSGAAAERLVKAADGKRRSLFDLRKAADRGRAGLKAEESAVLALDGARVVIDTKVERADRVTWNVGAVLPGAGELASQHVVIGAHFDHVGLGYQGGSRSNEYGVVHPGADDNASGTAGLLIAAARLSAAFGDEKSAGGGSRRSVMFLGFSAEEMGLIGSREFVKASPIDAKSICAMLNMDMIGRLRPESGEDKSDPRGKLDVAGTGTAEGFAELLKPLFERADLNVKSSPGGRGPSDHATFYGAGVPVLHFFTGLHEEYHTPRDTTDLINVEGGARIAALVSEVAQVLAERPEQLVFTSTDRGARAGREGPAEPSGPSMRSMKVRFGISPANYAEDDAGVGVGEVFDGTSAAEAGIRAGDRLVRWNGQPIEDVQHWMTYLTAHNPGDVVDVTLMRRAEGGAKDAPAEEVVVKVTLKARDQAAR